LQAVCNTIHTIAGSKWCSDGSWPSGPALHFGFIKQTVSESDCHCWGGKVQYWKHHICNTYAYTSL